MSHTHPDAGDLGGAVTVMAGTGAGQYRRLVTASHTPVIDQPFDTPIDSTSVIQIGPFRGRTIFYHNRYEDGGDWQLYGNAHDWIVSQQHMQRPVRTTPAVTLVIQIHFSGAACGRAGSSRGAAASRRPTCAPTSACRSRTATSRR